MKIEELNDDYLYEMSNFGSQVTGFPNNIILWTRTDEKDHGHSKYRVKIKKNKEWAAIYTVSSKPELVKNVNDTITSAEDTLIRNFIKQYSSHIINHIDGVTTSDEFILDVMKDRGA